MFGYSAFNAPSTAQPTGKFGLEFTNSKTKAKLTTNCKTLLTEANLTYLQRKNLCLGVNFVLDPKKQNLEKYDFGFAWSPATNAYFGLKHESLAKDTLQFGKFLMYFTHSATAASTVGTEFALDWQKKVLEAKLGLSHKLNDDTSAKLKVSHNGQLDCLLKHKVNDQLSLFATTGLNVKTVIADNKTKPLPVGVCLDIKW